MRSNIAVKIPTTVRITWGLVLIQERSHRTLLEQGATITQQRKDFQAAIAQQRKEIEALTADLQKVTAQLELSKSAPQTVLNNQ